MGAVMELRSEYNFLANTFKNYVGLRIQPREDHYYMFQLINDPRGKTTFTQSVSVSADNEDPNPANNTAAVTVTVGGGSTGKSK